MDILNLIGLGIWIVIITSIVVFFKLLKNKKDSNITAGNLPLQQNNTENKNTFNTIQKILLNLFINFVVFIILSVIFIMKPGRDIGLGVILIAVVLGVYLIVTFFINLFIRFISDYSESKKLLLSYLLPIPILILFIFWLA